VQALLHTAGTVAGCVLALVPALPPSARAAPRWPYLVMALGMAAGHRGGWYLSAAVLALLAAGWLCGSPSRRAEAGHHIQDFAIMPMLLVLTSSPSSATSAHAHGGGSMAAVALVIGLGWTCARLIRVLPWRGTDRGTRVHEVCSAGMAASMTFMAALALSHT
jgi:hypothetical protein